MNKKGFLFSFLLIAFSFLMIDKVFAFGNFDDCTFFTYTDEQISAKLSQLKTYLDNKGLDSSLYNKYLIFAYKSSGTVRSGFYLFRDDYLDNGSVYFNVWNNGNATNNNLSISVKSSNPWVRFTSSTVSNVGSFSSPYLLTGSSGTTTPSELVGSNTFYLLTNFDLKNSRGNVIFSQNYNPTPPIHNINFHLNGSEVFDTSDIMNPVLHQEDFTYSGTSDELHEYITHLTFMKSNSDYIGLYYDSAFTQSYNSSDTIDSDKDIYVKFQSKIYNVNNVDYFEFKFDDLALMENTISFNYHFKTVTQNGQNEIIQFSAPFGREYYTGCDDEGQNCTIDTKFTDKLFYDLDYINYDYSSSKSYTFNSNPEHISNSFSVIIPTEQLRGTYLYIDFDSEQDYEMIIHYKDDENSNNSYIRTVDLTGKYGAIFLPLYDNSNYAAEGSYYLTKFKVIGNVDIQVTDSRDMTNYNILQLYSMNYCNNQYLTQENNNSFEGSIYIDKSIPYSCDNTSGVFNFKIDNLTAKQTLRFVNHAYTELSDRRTIIEYDTRYFNYGILDTPYSTTQIEDPTTHEIETVGLSEFYNQLDKASIAGSKLTFQNAFNRFVNPIKFLFSNVTSLFNNYLSSSLQHYFFLIFSMTIIILIIRVIF